MPRPKKPVDPDETDTTDPADEAPDPTPSERMRANLTEDLDSDEIVSIHDALKRTQQAQGYVRVYRRGEGEIQFVYLTNVPIDSLVPDPEAVVARQFGGGEYKLKFCQSDGTYIRQISWKVHNSVPAGEFFQRKAEAAATAPMFALPSAGRGDNSDFLIALMKMQSDQAAANLNVMMQQNTAMMTAMTNMVAALKGGGGGQAGNTFIEALTVYDKLKGKSADIMDPMLKALDFMRKMIEDRAKESDESPPWVDFASSILEGFMRRMQAQQQGPMPGAPGLPPTPAQPEMRTAAGAPVPEAPKTESGGTPDLRTTIEVNEQPIMRIALLARMLLPNLLERVAAGATPDDGLDMLNNPLLVTDDQYDELVTVLKRDTWAKELFGREDVIEPHRGWFDGLRELILKQAEEDSKSET